MAGLGAVAHPFTRNGGKCLRTCLRSQVAIGLVAVVALGPLGCAHRLPEPITGSPEKLETGTVALAVSSAAPSAWFQPPGVVGASEGAKKGAKTGVIAPFMPGVVAIEILAPDPRGILVGLAMLGVGLVLAPVGAGVGATVGAIVAPAPDEVEQTAASLQRAVADANLPEALTAGILEGAGDGRIVASSTTTGVMVDSALEIDSAAVSLSSKDSTDWRPSLRLRVAISGRLLRAEDRAQLRSWTWEHEGAEAPFLEWGKDDARRLREELRKAAQALAERVLASVF